MKSLHEIVRDAQSNYLKGTTQIGEYVNWSMHDTLERIDAYLNSKHTSGSTDSLGREKPFFNIVSAACNIWFRATNIDRKDIKIPPDKASNVVAAFIANVHLHEWMKKARFGQFLKLWGRSLARYGSSVIKFVEKDGTLTVNVIPWNRLIVDPVDFDAIPRIEKFYLTPDQLFRRATPGDPDYANYDLESAKQLVQALQTRRTLDGFQKDNQAKFVELYEVHGEMDSRLLDKDPDLNLEDEDIIYRQQMHVISYVQGKDGEWNDFTLFKGKEAKDPYMITHLIEEEGRTLAIGAVEYLFDAQWMANHTMKNWKDQLDLACKLIFQTADSHFVGRNVLTAIENGDILIHDENKPLTEVPNGGHDITNLSSFLSEWTKIGQEITSTPGVMRGEMPTGQKAYRLQALVSQQAQALFEVMGQNKGLAIQDMMHGFILPYIEKKWNNTDEIVATLENEHISQIDAMYIPREAVRQYNKRTTDAVLNNAEATLNGAELSPIQPFNQQQEELNVQKSMGPLGNKRFFAPDEIGKKSWKEILKNFEMTAEVHVTNEDMDDHAIMAALSQALQIIATNPLVLQDPNAKLIFSKILQQTGVISPMELSTATPTAPVMPQAQPGAPAQGQSNPQPAGALPVNSF